MKYLVFGGGGQVALHFAKTAITKGHEVVSVVRDDSQCVPIPLHSAYDRGLTSSNSELEKIGAKPEILSIEEATVTQLTSLLKSTKADGVLFAAGAGGKGDPGRVRRVNYEGAVKVYDAMEAGNVKRLVLIGAVDIRDRSKGWPEWYDEDDSGSIDTSCTRAS